VRHLKTAAGTSASITTSLLVTQEKNSHSESIQKNSTFLLQPICHLPGRFGEDQLSGLEDITSQQRE